MLDFSTWSPETIAGVTLVSLLLVVIVIVSFMCIQAGLFHVINIQTKQPEFGELVVMYRCGRGPYSGSGPLFTEAHSLLPKYNTIGVYYDDPHKRSADNLRYIVGLVVAQDGAEANPDDVAVLESHGYQKVVLPAVKHAVVTDFPYCSTLSCIFAVFRVYPALKEYVEKRELCAHPYLELYDSSSSRILFMGPLELQDSFYVPDLSDENVVSSPEEGSSEDEEDEEGKSEEGRVPAEEEGSGAEGTSLAAGSSLGGKDGSVNWEQSASLLAEGVSGDAAAAETGAQLQGTAEESDTNTGSSFEEIDPSETASESSPASASPSSPASESSSAGQAAASAGQAAASAGQAVCSESAPAQQTL